VKITSISHAISLLGRIGLSRWLTLFLYSDAQNVFAVPLLESSMFKAKFMSELALVLKQSKEFQEKAYLTGMISLLNTLLNTTFEEIFDEISFEEEIKSAVTGEGGRLGKLLLISDMASKGDEQLFLVLAKLGISQEKLQEILTTCYAWLEENKDAV
jgi:EAL and modified HD-GYP domain-containing signal transduction protein